MPPKVKPTTKKAPIKGVIRKTAPAKAAVKTADKKKTVVVSKTKPNELKVKPKLCITCKKAERTLGGFRCDECRKELKKKPKPLMRRMNGPQPLCLQCPDKVNYKEKFPEHPDYTAAKGGAFAAAVCPKHGRCIDDDEDEEMEDKKEEEAKCIKCKKAMPDAGSDDCYSCRFPPRGATFKCMADDCDGICDQSLSVPGLCSSCATYDEFTIKGEAVSIKYPPWFGAQCANCGEDVFRQFDYGPKLLCDTCRPGDFQCITLNCKQKTPSLTYKLICIDCEKRPPFMTCVGATGIRHGDYITKCVDCKVELENMYSPLRRCLDGEGCREVPEESESGSSEDVEMKTEEEAKKESESHMRRMDRHYKFCKKCPDDPDKVDHTEYFPEHPDFVAFKNGAIGHTVCPKHGLTGDKRTEPETIVYKQKWKCPTDNCINVTRANENDFCRACNEKGVVEYQGKVVTIFKDGHFFQTLCTGCGTSVYTIARLSPTPRLQCYDCKPDQKHLCFCDDCDLTNRDEPTKPGKPLKDLCEDCNKLKSWHDSDFDYVEIKDGKYATTCKACECELRCSTFILRECFEGTGCNAPPSDEDEDEEMEAEEEEEMKDAEPEFKYEISKYGDSVTSINSTYGCLARHCKLSGEVFSNPKFPAVLHTVVAHETYESWFARVEAAFHLTGAGAKEYTASGRPRSDSEEY